MLSKLPDFIREIGFERPLVVTDSGLFKAGHASHAVEYIEKAGFEVSVYSEAEENPCNASITKCMEFAKAANIDGIIGLGGGSSMDTAKGCNFLLTNGGSMKDFHGYGKAEKAMLPFIAIPTTSGTGSECQSYALISDDETHTKMACGDTKALARVAILDPDLTASQPKRVATFTGLDALAHAIETAVCKARNPLSEAYSQKAFGLLASAIGAVIRNEATEKQRSDMQLGAAFAGLAIENSMLGAAHACANPLTARFDITHGHAVALLLPHVIRLNSSLPEISEIYNNLCLGTNGTIDPEQGLASWVERLLVAAEMQDFQSLGALDSAIPELAELAADQWTGNFNPKPVSKQDFEYIYRNAFAFQSKARSLS